MSHVPLLTKLNEMDSAPPLYTTTFSEICQLHSRSVVVLEPANIPSPSFHILKQQQKVAFPHTLHNQPPILQIVKNFYYSPPSSNMVSSNSQNGRSIGSKYLLFLSWSIPLGSGAIPLTTVASYFAALSFSALKWRSSHAFIYLRYSL
jgi:hypothetical protein